MCSAVTRSYRAEVIKQNAERFIESGRAASGSSFALHAFVTYTKVSKGPQIFWVKQKELCLVHHRFDTSTLMPPHNVSVSESG